jgi:hypothetical protein
MGKRGMSGKPQLRQQHADHELVEIFADDHRNNSDFLKKHPNVKVIDKKSEKRIKKPHEHHSVSMHHPNTETKKHHPATPAHSSKKKKPGEGRDQTILDKELLDLENDSQELADDDVLKGDEESKEGGKFLFHEQTNEHNDPLSDLDYNAHEKSDSRYPHLSEELSTSKADVATDLKIDSNSWNLQKDAKDGSVSFKATFTFNDTDGLEHDLSDFDIILTQVTT